MIPSPLRRGFFIKEFLFDLSIELYILVHDSQGKFEKMKVYKQLLEAKKEIRSVGIQGNTLLEFGGKKGNQKSQGKARGIADVLSIIPDILFKHDLHFECNDLELTLHQTRSHTDNTDIVVKSFNNKEYSQPRLEYANFILKGVYTFVNSEGERTQPTTFIHQGSASDPMFNGAVCAQTSALRTFLLFSCGIPTMDGEDHDKFKPKNDIHNVEPQKAYLPNIPEIDVDHPDAAAILIQSFTKEAFSSTSYEQACELWVKHYLTLSQKISNKPDNFKNKIEEVFSTLKQRELKVG